MLHDNLHGRTTRLPLRSTALLLCTCGLIGLAACGNGNDRRPETAQLNGQLVQEGVVKVTSADGDGLGNVGVTLINRADGSLAGLDLTDTSGVFNFNNIPAGDFLLGFDFQGSQDFDLDGGNDYVSFLMPLSLSAGETFTLTQSLAARDSDADGISDAIDVLTDVADGSGDNLRLNRQLRFLNGDMRLDDNLNGFFDPGETILEDLDNNGLADLPGGSGPLGTQLRGRVDSITGGSITVNGQVFLLSDASSFSVQGNGASLADIAVGDEVALSTFQDSSGRPFALSTRLLHDLDNPLNDDARDLTFRGTVMGFSGNTLNLSGLDLTVDGRTRVFLENGSIVSLDELEPGDRVLVSAMRLGDNSLLPLSITQQPGSILADPSLQLVGTPTVLSNSLLSMNGLDMQINGDTAFTLFSGLPGTFSSFATDQRFLVTTTLVGDAWTATELNQDFSSMF